MITVIEGTNRNGSKTAQIAEICTAILKEHSMAKVSHLKLSELKDFTIHGEMYDADKVAPSIINAQEEHIKPADKWVVVIPEYNGGMPGIFKLFIDAISVRDYAENFKGKKVCLIGLASGRGGNIRGLDDISNYFHYLGMHVFPNKFPISQIEGILDSEGLTSEVHDGLKKVLTEFDKF